MKLEPVALCIDDQPLTLRRAALEEILPLRQVVLIDGTDRDSPVFDGDHDPATIHIGAFDATGRPVSCATIMRQTDHGQPAWRLRGMATDADWRSQGVGSAVVRYIERAIAASGESAIMWCNARIGALAFYRKVGWETVGDRFLIPGVGEHMKMVRTLSAPHA